MKLVCYAYIPDDKEREEVCGWLKQTEGCTCDLFGMTVAATYTKTDAPDSANIYRGLIRLFERYPEHTINHHAGKGGK